MGKTVSRERDHDSATKNRGAYCIWAVELVESVPASNPKDALCATSEVIGELTL